MGVVTTQIMMNPFLVFGGAPAPASLILRSAGGGGDILRSPDDGSEIERSE